MIPSGLDLAQLPFQERGRQLPARRHGSRSPAVSSTKKGVLDAAEAMALAAARRVSDRARFVGFGEQEAPLRSRLDELVAASNGRLSAEIVDGRPAGAVRAALADTDVLLTASQIAADGDAETLGLVNLEAQAMGVPVVTAASGGVPEAVSPQAGVLVAAGGSPAARSPPGSSTCCARPQDWAEMGRAGRRHVAARFELGARTADLEEQWLALARTGRAAGCPRAVPGLSGRVSVVMVTRDRRELLDQALDALAAQTRPADEVLVVDNGSTDGTAELLAERVAAQQPPRPAGSSRRPPACRSREARNRCRRSLIRRCHRVHRRRLPAAPDLAGSAARRASPAASASCRAARSPIPRTSCARSRVPNGHRPNSGSTRRATSPTTRGARRQRPARPEGPFDLGFADQISGLLGRWFGRYPFGEDTELGWRVKRAGAGSRFAVHAVVEHHVFPPDPALQIRRGILAAGFPLLVGRVPELRDVFLWHRYVLGSPRLRIWAAIGGAGIGRRQPEARPAVLALPYAWKLLAAPPSRPQIAAAGRARRGSKRPRGNGFAGLRQPSRAAAGALASPCAPAVVERHVTTMDVRPPSARSEEPLQRAGTGPAVAAVSAAGRTS